VLDGWRPYTSRFVFVVKQGKEEVIEFAQQLPIDADFVEPVELRGIANGLSYVEGLVQEPFIVVLGDCFHTGSFEFPPDMEAGVGVLPHATEAQVRRNFAVHVNDDRIVRVVEKPTEVDTDLCGMGFYFFPPSVFDAIRRTRPSPRTNEVEITDVLQTLIDDGVTLRPVWLRGSYINVTHPPDLDEVGRLLRAASAPASHPAAGPRATALQPYDG
jgi:dTDP-glucose pyrophosphorylase